MNNDLIERIYEAAFVPEKWLGVIEDLTRVSGSAAGGIVLIRSDRPLSDGVPAFTFGDQHGFIATEPFGEAVRRSIADFPSQSILRCDRWFALRLGGYQGFVRSADVMSPQELEHDPAQLSLAAIGLGVDATLMTPTGASEGVAMALQRRVGVDLYDDSAIAALNIYGPHLSRASLISARLSLEHAISTVATLQAIGLPAAVMRGSGAVLATNALFDAMQEVFRPAAAGRVALASEAADGLLAGALENVRTRRAAIVQSIPMPGRGGAPSAVIHVLPLVRSAFDIFSGAEILLVATEVRASGPAPSPSLLSGLYDLTPAEARLASALGSGQPLAAAAQANRITVKSARTYLERIFAKTGTSRQSELVPLLRSVTPLGAVELEARAH